MKIGKNQQFVLSRMKPGEAYPRPGVARSAWLHNVLISMEKHGLVRAAAIWEKAPAGPSQGAAWFLTTTGEEVAASLRSAPVESPTPNNKTVRQAEHIKDSINARNLRGALAEARNAGVMLAMIDRAEGTDNASRPAAIVELEAADFAQQTADRFGGIQGALTLLRWAYVEGYAAQRAYELLRKVQS